MKPIWLQNLKWLIESQPPVTSYETMCIIDMFANNINKWIDDNLVMGNEENETICKYVYGKLNAMAKFSMIENKNNDPFLFLYKRLENLLI